MSHSVHTAETTHLKSLLFQPFRDILLKIDVQMSFGAHKEWVQFLLSVSGCVISAVQSIVPWPVVRNHLCFNGRRLTAESTCSSFSLCLGHLLPCQLYCTASLLNMSPCVTSKSVLWRWLAQRGSLGDEPDRKTPPASDFLWLLMSSLCTVFICHTRTLHNVWNIWSTQLTSVILCTLFSIERLSDCSFVVTHGV